MMRSTPRWLVYAFVVTVAALYVQPVSARVFERWGKSNADDPARRFSWDFAYESKMNLNGIEGMVRVFGVEDRVDHVVDNLKEFYSDGDRTGQFFVGDVMGWGVGSDQKQAFRYFIQQGNGPQRTMVYQIAQPLEAYKRSLGKPMKSQMDEVPDYPGSKPTYYMKDYGTETSLEVSTTSSAPDTIARFYETALEAKGWKAPLKQEGAMRMFLKGDAVILISAHPALDGHSRLTRVFKKLAIDPK
ncbi:MAG: hypothetical protein ACI9TH_004587 [Kiritimatiellia bacterium]|jgi:hypothetical protein